MPKGLETQSFERCTLPKFNIAPENQWLEDVFPTEIVNFFGDMLAFRGVRIYSEEYLP